MAKVTGIVYVAVNGKRQKSKEGASIELGGMERTAVMGAAQLIGYSEKPMPAVVTCTIAHTADTNIDDLRDFVDGTVTFETDTGTTYIVTEAFTTKVLKLTGGEGDLECEFSGNSAV